MVKFNVYLLFVEIYGYTKQYILCKILLDKIENSANTK